MAALFEPSLSTSAMRPPFSTADAPSMADSLPSINFGFDELRTRMAAFTDRFDSFIAKGRKRVLEERNQFRINVAELEEDQRMRRRDLEILTQKSSQHDQMLQQQAAETAEMEQAIDTLTQQKDQASLYRASLQSQITTTKKDIATRQGAQLQHARGLDAQSRLNLPELDFWETYLGLRIEGVGKIDRLRFVFYNLDEREWSKEAWFELDTERREYAVVDFRPKVEREEIEQCVDGLNSSRDLGQFLRKMRGVFAVAIKS
ncbi:MAG: hypothetical protein Q9217_002358 [Psora testacea]